MSYDNNPKRFWFSCRQVDTAARGTRYDSGWCFGDDLESAKISALNSVKRTHELFPNSFKPNPKLKGSLMEFSLVQDIPENGIYDSFTVSV